MSKPAPFESRPYRLGVGIVLLNAAGLAFVAQRSDAKEPAWQFPQGGIDDGESPVQAALRELEEETGTAKAEIIAETAEWVAYDLPQDIADKCWKGRFRGQKQKWFAARFTGSDADININTAHPEFSHWQWMRLDEVASVIVPFKRALYEQVVAEFLPVAQAMAKNS
jgi:putative (di)nucleoside polyphosphate hydrolase